MAGKKSSGTPFGLRPSEKELPERRSGTKIPLDIGIYIANIIGVNIGVHIYIVL
jgi:hypothetical protein